MLQASGGHAPTPSTGALPPASPLGAQPPVPLYPPLTRSSGPATGDWRYVRPETQAMKCARNLPIWGKRGSEGVWSPQVKCLATE